MIYKWQEIANDLRLAIHKGELVPGSMLPSETDLMSKYDVASGTVRRALLELRIEGWVRPHQGKGVVVLDPGHPEPLL